MPATESPETFAETASAYAADREAQFLEIAGEIPDDGAEPVEVETEEAAEAEAPAEEAAEAPAAEAPAAVVDDAPESKPFTYTVNGEAKPFEGGQLIVAKDGTTQGAVFPADHLQRLQDRLQRADYLESVDKDRYQKLARYDGIEYKTPTGETVKGYEAVEHYAAENARLTAAVQLLAATLEDPEKLSALYGDPREMQLLTRELGLAAQSAESKVRSQWSQRQTQATQQETEQQSRAEVTNTAITGAVQHWAKAFPSLTPQDITTAVQHFSRVGTSIVRPATPDEAKAAGVKPGELVIDHPVIHEWLKDRADLRAEAVKASTAATKAATENAARLATTLRKPAPATKKATTSSAATPRELSGPELWAKQRERMLSGQFDSGDE